MGVSKRINIMESFGCLSMFIGTFSIVCTGLLNAYEVYLNR
jgi:hypothetical protein